MRRMEFEIILGLMIVTGESEPVVSTRGMRGTSSLKLSVLDSVVKQISTYHVNLERCIQWIGHFKRSSILSVGGASL